MRPFRRVARDLDDNFKMILKTDEVLMMGSIEFSVSSRRSEMRTENWLEKFQGVPYLSRTRGYRDQESRLFQIIS